MKHPRHRFLMPVIVALLFAFLISIGWLSDREPVVYEPEGATVAFVIDGDTVELADGERVRYIGIDTPEIGQIPGEGPECYGPEALARNRELVNGRRVWLVREDSDRDRYGRLLRHVYLSDPRTEPQASPVGLTLVSEGYAEVVFIRPDVRQYDALRAAQDAARDADLGLWSACK